MPPDRRKTLLVVDSDDEIRESLTAALRRDYRVLRAATGEAALQMMQKEDVDLMLLEVHLRGISGFEVLKIAQGELPLRRDHRHLEDERARHRDRSDAPRRVPLHLQRLRHREHPHAVRQCQPSDRISAATSRG